MDANASGISPFDIVIIGAIVASGIVALTRGFVTEVLSLAAWVGALLVAFYGFPLIAGLGRSLVSPAELSDVITLVALFFASLLGLRLAASLIGDHIRSSKVGALDRSLGALFGLLRGVLIVSAVYFVISYVVPERRQPDWVTSARMQPLVSFGAEMVGLIAPTLLSRGEEPDRGDIFDRLGKAVSAPKPADSAKQAVETAYRDAQRALLDEAVKSVMDDETEKDDRE